MDTGTDRGNQRVDDRSGYDAGKGFSEAVAICYVDKVGRKESFVVSHDDPTYTQIEFGYQPPRYLDFQIRDGVLYVRWGR